MTAPPTSEPVSETRIAAAPPSEPRIGRVLTIAEVAKLAGWTRWRMWKHLRRLDVELGGMLLCNVGRGTRRATLTVSLEALQRIAPQWFRDAGESFAERLEDVELRVTRLERVVDLHTERLAAG